MSRARKEEYVISVKTIMPSWLNHRRLRTDRQRLNSLRPSTAARLYAGLDRDATMWHIICFTRIEPPNPTRKHVCR